MSIHHVYHRERLDTNTQNSTMFGRKHDAPLFQYILVKNRYLFKIHRWLELSNSCYELCPLSHGIMLPPSNCVYYRK